MPGFSRGAGVARGVPAWYRVPVYCPRNVTAPGGFPRCLRRDGGARGPAGEGSDPEAAAEDREAGRDLLGSFRPRSSSGLCRGSEADLSLRVGVTPGATLPRTGGLGSPEGAASWADDGPLATGGLLAGVLRGVAFPSG